jgi:hypothetical protein
MFERTVANICCQVQGDKWLDDAGHDVVGIHVKLLVEYLDDVLGLAALLVVYVPDIGAGLVIPIHS